MGGVSQDQGDNLAVELNLVPFIDLLSALVLFLLVTAVWMQIAAIQASVDSKGKSSATTAPQSRLGIHVNERGFQLTWPAAAAKFNPPRGMNKLKDGTYDLVGLTKIIEPFFSQKNAFSSVVVSGDYNVSYGLIVQTIDSAKTAGIPTVALSTE